MASASSNTDSLLNYNPVLAHLQLYERDGKYYSFNQDTRSFVEVDVYEFYKKQLVPEVFKLYEESFPNAKTS
jgi:hypothetical protein